MEENNLKFKELLSQIEGGNELFDYLVETDFFTAPGSTRYYNNYEGGLVDHSIRVYNNLCYMGICNKYKPETIIKVALCHELGKVNFFEQYMKNEKIDGQWVSTPAYKVKDASDRYLVGDMGFTSYMIASRYLNFTDEEIVAICNYGHVNNPKDNMEIQDILKKYPLTLYLYMADMMAMYLDENE